MILVGSSGCGKTTALRMVAGLEKPTSGAIRIGDRVVNDVSARDRDIAMVFQNYALYPHMTRGAQPRLSACASGGCPGARSIAACERSREMLGLDELLKRRPAQLSGGQRQRVAMGRALVREPEVFLLDEPLSNLDAKLRVQMRAELKRLHGRLGITTIYVTHDQVEAMTLGDRIAVISDGKLQQLGSPAGGLRPSRQRVRGRLHRQPADEPPARAGHRRPRGGRRLRRRPGRPARRRADRRRPPRGARPGRRTPGRRWISRSTVVEPLGDEVIVHGSVAADIARLAEAGEAALLTARDGARTEVVARLHPRDRPAEGTTIRLGVDPADVHLFDAETGLAIDDRRL